jgi:proline iminopeptidase
MDVKLSDGYTIFVEPVGDGFPIVVLHGGPGMDHTMFRPYLDALGDEFRLLYVDERGQGRSERVDASKLSLEVFARDVDLIADALELEAFALLGHSFGAIIAGWHATEIGTATAYVISGGGESSASLDRDVEESIDAREDGDVIRESWDLEQTVATEEDLKRLMEMQMPFHFHGEPPKDAFQDTVYSPDVLRHFANIGYGDFDFTDKLGEVAKPTLVIVGEHDPTTTPRAARALADGIPNAELEIVPGAGHMSFIEANDRYIERVRGFLSGVAIQA